MYVASTEPLPHGNRQLNGDQQKTRLINGQDCQETAPNNSNRGSIEIVETQPDRRSKYNSQGSVAGSSLVSCLKTDSQWQENNLRSENSKKYSGLESLTDRSSRNDKNNSMTSVEHMRVISVNGNFGKARQEERNDLEKEFSKRRNETIELDDRSYETQNISASKKVLRTYGTKGSSILTAKSVELKENTTRSEFERKLMESIEAVTTYGDKKSDEPNINYLPVLSSSCEHENKKSNKAKLLDTDIQARLNTDDNGIITKIKHNIVPSISTNKVQLENCARVETNSIQGDLFANRHTPDSHDNSSDIIKAHNTIIKLNVSSIVKSDSEVFNLDNTPESTANTGNNTTKSKKKTTESHGHSSKKYNTRQANRDGSVQIVQTSTKKDDVSNSKNNTSGSTRYNTTKKYSTANISNTSSSENVCDSTKMDESVEIINTNLKMIEKVYTKFKSLEKECENFDRKLKSVVQKIDDLSFIVISDKCSDGNDEMSVPSLKCNKERKDYEETGKDITLLILLRCTAVYT